MQLRGQIAIEMFFAFTFAILLVFWLVNYVENYSEVSKRSTLKTQQAFVARDILKVVNSVCVNGGNPKGGEKISKITISSPCLNYKTDKWYYDIVTPDAAPYTTLQIKSEVANETISLTASCKVISNANTTRCSNLDYLCIYKTNEPIAGVDDVMVRIQSGVCD
ncbi:hypothetical protein HY989_06075 [Candidatus Micrarchaeota archaeon]|nr:hypothetical protein [Candidatus Micrarchaeota archaeon]